jgi:hypothetical protein
MKRLLLIFVIVSAIMLTGCATIPRSDWVPETIAILPFANNSADVGVQNFARYSLFIQLQNKGYNCIDLASIDNMLNDMGITEGGQLETVTLDELGKKLGADGIVYGTVLTAKRVMAGVYFKKEFSAEYKLYRYPDGANYWDATYLSKDSRIVLNPAELLKTAAEEMAKEIAVDTLTKLFKSHPLREQIDMVTKVCIRSFPRY